MHLPYFYRMLPYDCLATGEKNGFIEVVQDSETIANIQKLRKKGKGLWDSHLLMDWLKERNSDPTQWVQHTRCNSRHLLLSSLYPVPISILTCQIEIGIRCIQCYCCCVVVSSCLYTSHPACLFWINTLCSAQLCDGEGVKLISHCSEHLDKPAIMRVT